MIGTPGSGRAVFAFQALVNGARRHREPAIFVAFEESSPHFVANAAAFGWDVHEAELRWLSEDQGARVARRDARREEIRRLRGGGADGRRGAQAPGA